MANTWTTLLDAVYPTGTLYFSTNSTSPATRFGGTWTQIEDAFIAAEGSAYITGTVAAYSGDKAMTVDQMPNHNHQIDDETWLGYWTNYSNANSVVAGGSGWTLRAWSNGYNPKCITKVSTGGGQNFAPYYYSTYIWRRTA